MTIDFASSDNDKIFMETSASLRQWKMDLFLGNNISLFKNICRTSFIQLIKRCMELKYHIHSF